MTAAIMPASDAHIGADERVARMWAAIEPEFLAAVGWDPKRQVLVFPQQHPQLGWRACRVAGCRNDGRRGWGLCPACTRRWQALAGMSVEDFLVMPKPVQRCSGIHPCAVEGCQRPGKSARLRLCNTHDQQRRTIGLPLEQFLVHPDVVPLVSFGPCAVAACTRDRVGRGPYCHQHQKSYTLAMKHDPHLDVERWCRTASAVAENSEVSLRGLPPRIAAEVIFGVQQRTKSGAKTSYLQLRPLCDVLRRAELTSVEDLATDDMTRHCRVLASSIVKSARRLGLVPETERRKDIWDLFVFGHAGNLTFTGISQPWLREAVKCWAYDDLPRRRGNRVGTVTQGKINSVVCLSESLRLQRTDHGENITALVREDITAFCNRMGYREDHHQISARTRLNHCRDVRGVLSRMRAMGLTRPDKLQELLDHRRLSTTQIYYRVGEERRREAVERVTAMQFDRHGNRVWRQAKTMLDSEHVRRAVGEVAVPYGGCSEPSNVAAGGQDCPVRFRCIGCGHFSTDISYMPDLERYLADLLRHRERLTATLDADEWAKTEAMPSDNEITRIRRLIDRMKGDIDELTDEERAQIDDAIAVVRRGRSKVVGLGMPRIQQPLPDVRPERSA